MKTFFSKSLKKFVQEELNEYLSWKANFNRCGWENKNYFDGGGANKMSFKEATKGFAERKSK